MQIEAAFIDTPSHIPNSRSLMEMRISEPQTNPFQQGTDLLFLRLIEGAQLPEQRRTNLNL